LIKRINFSIAYSALNYILHEQNQYAYKLSGHDEDWNYVGSRKEAFYTNIAPGKYTFQVIASNNDGVWNETGRNSGFYQQCVADSATSFGQ